MEAELLKIGELARDWKIRVSVVPRSEITLSAANYPRDTWQYTPPGPDLARKAHNRVGARRVIRNSAR